MDFLELIELIEFQSSMDWNYVEREAENRVRFDWAHGAWSFWVNDDFTIEGKVPEPVKSELSQLDILITYV